MDAKEMLEIMNSTSAFIQGVHHAYGRTDGSFAWPNSLEGDLLRQGLTELEAAITELRNTSKQMEGKVLVPEEPTESEMLAFTEEWFGVQWDRNRDHWIPRFVASIKAMIAAKGE